MMQSQIRRDVYGKWGKGEMLPSSRWHQTADESPVVNRLNAAGGYLNAAIG